MSVEQLGRGSVKSLELFSNMCKHDFFYGGKWHGFLIIQVEGHGAFQAVVPGSSKPGLLLPCCLSGGSWEGKSKEPMLWTDLGSALLTVAFHCP